MALNKEAEKQFILNVLNQKTNEVPQTTLPIPLVVERKSLDVISDIKRTLPNANSNNTEIKSTKSWKNRIVFLAHITFNNKKQSVFVIYDDKLKWISNIEKETTLTPIDIPVIHFFDISRQGLIWGITDGIKIDDQHDYNGKICFFIFSDVIELSGVVQQNEIDNSSYFVSLFSIEEQVISTDQNGKSEFGGIKFDNINGLFDAKTIKAVQDYNDDMSFTFLRLRKITSDIIPFDYLKIKTDFQMIDLKDASPVTETAFLNAKDKIQGDLDNSLPISNFSFAVGDDINLSNGWTKIGTLIVSQSDNAQSGVKEITYGPYTYSGVSYTGALNLGEHNLDTLRAQGTVRPVLNDRKFSVRDNPSSNYGPFQDGEALGKTDANYVLGTKQQIFGTTLTEVINHGNLLNDHTYETKICLGSKFSQDPKAIVCFPIPEAELLTLNSKADFNVNVNFRFIKRGNNIVPKYTIGFNDIGATTNFSSFAFEDTANAIAPRNYDYNSFSTNMNERAIGELENYRTPLRMSGADYDNTIQNNDNLFKINKLWYGICYGSYWFIQGQDFELSFNVSVVASVKGKIDVGNVSQNKTFGFGITRVPTSKTFYFQRSLFFGNSYASNDPIFQTPYKFFLPSKSRESGKYEIYKADMFNIQPARMDFTTISTNDYQTSANPMNIPLEVVPFSNNLQFNTVLKVNSTTCEWYNYGYAPSPIAGKCYFSKSTANTVSIFPVKKDDNISINYLADIGTATRLLQNSTAGDEEMYIGSYLDNYGTETGAKTTTIVGIGDDGIGSNAPLSNSGFALYDNGSGGATADFDYNSISEVITKNSPIKMKHILTIRQKDLIWWYGFNENFTEYVKYQQIYNGTYPYLLNEYLDESKSFRLERFNVNKGGQLLDSKFDRAQIDKTNLSNTVLVSTVAETTDMNNTDADTVDIFGSTNNKLFEISADGTKQEMESKRIDFRLNTNVYETLTTGSPKILNELQMKFMDIWWRGLTDISDFAIDTIEIPAGNETFKIAGSNYTSLSPDGRKIQVKISLYWPKFKQDGTLMPNVDWTEIRFLCNKSQTALAVPVPDHCKHKRMLNISFDINLSKDTDGTLIP